MRSRLFIALSILVAFVAVAAFCLTPTQAEQEANKNPLKVGVADLSYIVDKYVKKLDDENRLKDIIRVENEKIKATQERIKAIDADIQQKSELLSPDSEEIRNLIFERDQLKFKLEQLVKETKRKLNLGKVQILASIYEDFQKLSTAYAKKFGYDLILAKNEPNLKGKDYENLMLQISMQPVYYFSAEMDVTEFVLAEMNRIYNIAKANAKANNPAPANQPAN